MSLNHFYQISASNISIWPAAARKLTWVCGHTWQSHECPTPWCRRWTQRRPDKRKDSIWLTPRCWGGLWVWRSPDLLPGSTSYRCDLEEDRKKGPSNTGLTDTCFEFMLSFFIPATMATLVSWSEISQQLFGGLSWHLDISMLLCEPA